MTAPLPPSMACDRCCRVHPGPVRVCTTFPGPTYRLMCSVIPKGERSAWVARLVQRELEGK